MLTLTGRGNVQHALSAFGKTSANQQNHEELILISWPKHIFYLKCLLPSWQYYKGHMVFVQNYWWLPQAKTSSLICKGVGSSLWRLMWLFMCFSFRLETLFLRVVAGYRIQSGIHIVIDRMPSCVWNKRFTYELWVYWIYCTWLPLANWVISRTWCHAKWREDAFKSGRWSRGPLKGLFSWVQKPHKKELKKVHSSQPINLSNTKIVWKCLESLNVLLGNLWNLFLDARFRQLSSCSCSFCCSSLSFCSINLEKATNQSTNTLSSSYWKLGTVMECNWIPWLSSLSICYFFRKSLDFP